MELLPVREDTEQDVAVSDNLEPLSTVISETLGNFQVSSRLDKKEAMGKIEDFLGLDKSKAEWTESFTDIQPHQAPGDTCQ